MLGGRARGCRIELHDVAFAIGERLEDLHEQLLDQWFGEADGLHVDAYAVIEQVAGYRVRLVREPAEGGPKLYFINVGGYSPGDFAEQHAYAFIAASGPAAVKASAKARLLKGREQVHKDDLFEIDDCLHIDTVGGWQVRLEPDDQAVAPTVVNGYFPLPRKTISAWRKRRAQAPVT